MGILSDLPTRLRFTADAHEGGMQGGYGCMRDAADEIERLQKALAAEREACAKIAEQVEQDYLSPEYATPQPVGSIAERLACRTVAEAIRNRKG